MCYGKARSITLRFLFCYNETEIENHKNHQDREVPYKLRKYKILTTKIILPLFFIPIMSANASALAKPVYDRAAEPDLSVEQAQQNQLSIKPAETKLPDDALILGTVEADVTGDGLVDIVYLTGRRIHSGSIYSDDLSLSVKSGADSNFKTHSFSRLGGYRTNLFAGDFSGDKVADVYLEVESGGSGGWSYHNIVSFSGNQTKEIFGNDNNQSRSIKGEFVDGLKVELTNLANDKKVAIDVSDRLQDYLRLGIYGEDGIVKKETQTMMAPFSRLTPIDQDNDGIFELKGIQRISGAYRADGIADVESVLKYKDDYWEFKSVKVIISL